MAGGSPRTWLNGLILWKDAKHCFVGDIYNNVSSRGLPGFSLVVPENEVGVTTPVVGVDSRFVGIDERDRDSIRVVSTREPDDKLFVGAVGRGVGIRVVGAGGIHEK